MKPEEKARQKIDQLLQEAGWSIQDHKDLNLGASLGIAVREFPLETGFADYLFPNYLPSRTNLNIFKAGHLIIRREAVHEDSSRFVSFVQEFGLK
jgi:type I site-specific restriction endonuclease